MTSGNQMGGQQIRWSLVAHVCV